MGRTLDCLLDTDRRALLTDLMVHMVKEFDLSLEPLHNDSTSLTLHGEYKDATGKLCTRANLKHIAGNHGMFVTIMPRSRKMERDAQFRRNADVQATTPAGAASSRQVTRSAGSYTDLRKEE